MDLYYTLDNLMKEKMNEGLSRVQSSDVITLDAENSMWESGLLGDQNQKQLCNMLIYLLGIHCALRGEEHRNLR